MAAADTSNGQTAEWYYVAGGQKIGPVSESVIRQVAEAGTISDKSLVWKEGMNEWLPVTQTTLSKLFQMRTPPPLPPSVFPSVPSQAQPVASQPSSQPVIPSRSVEPASFWYRAAGWAIDMVVLIPVWLLGSVFGKLIAELLIVALAGIGIVDTGAADFEGSFYYGSVYYSHDYPVMASFGPAITLLLCFLGYCLYNAVMEHSRLHGSVGKLLVGMYVEDNEHRSLAFGSAFQRNAFKGLAIVPLFLLIMLRPVSDVLGWIVFAVAIVAVGSVYKRTKGEPRTASLGHDKLSKCIVFKK